MGKKSREKLERRQRQAAADAQYAELDVEFERQRAEFEAWLSEHNAEDACISLCVSDLWLPNVSSLVKHVYAFGVIASMAPARFIAANRIETYQQFRDFAEQLYVRMPSFPMLEDFVPESDWGEIRIDFDGALRRTFYGGAVERITDYIGAFLMVHGQMPEARRDIRAALAIQNYLTSNIDRSLVGSADDIEPGHVEIPAEPFWAACVQVLRSISELPEVLQVDNALVASMGQFASPTTWGAFGDGVMTGAALPVFLLDVGALRLPISIRNALAAIIQLWADRTVDFGALAQNASTTIGEFIATRFNRADFVPGPLKLVTRTNHLPYVFAAVLKGKRKLYFVIALSDADIQRLPTIQDAVNTLVSSKDWGIWQKGIEHGVQLCRRDGTLPENGDVVLIAVLARVSTSLGFINLPKTSAHVIPLTDFVALLDVAEDIDELDRFWAFEDENSAIRGPVGIVDRFAAFRDSDGVLVEGAVMPNIISLDPLWGSRWRYRQLHEFWGNAPPMFPNDSPSSWRPSSEGGGLFRLEGKHKPVMSWCAVVGRCSAHALVQAERELDVEDGRVLVLLGHCLADSLSLRQDIVVDLPIFSYRRIVTNCHARGDALVSAEHDDAGIDDRPLFSDWACTVTPEGDVNVDVQVNLLRVRQCVTDTTDAGFEVEAAIAWMDGLSDALGLEGLPPAMLISIQATSDRKPRFMMKAFDRRIDVPQYADPAVPSLEHYKTARRDLAFVFKDLDAKEGRYELAAAKNLIDPARDRLREVVHTRIAAFRREDLIAFCIEQLDALMAKYDEKVVRVKISLAHEVTYDRSGELAEAHDNFVKDSRNFRYLLECCVSLRNAGNDGVTPQKVIALVATIDWLHVLYGASDALHNGIDVGGLEIDHSFIPEVFYSQNLDERKAAFATESADMQLGLGVNVGDEVSEISVDSPEWQRLDAMFNDQHGVQFRQFFAGLAVLSCWPSVNETADFRWSYLATKEELRTKLVESIEDLSVSQADDIISLATLDSKGVRRLLGKSIDEADVPVWDHNKRGDRYNIKPLIAMEDGSFRWGAAAAERAIRIWRSTTANGYLPADFDWPKVASAVRTIKEQLDTALEVMAHKVVQRGTSFVARGIDFKRRFPRENFDDVGDYDVLAFWPDKNQWLVIECKHNQPAFCLKDARRLRERIFGDDRDRAQFTKIERRREFFEENVDRLRPRLGWPTPPDGIPRTYCEVYVSRDIHWWMRNPPYSVPTEFVRIDVLDHCLRQKGLLS